MSVRPSNTPSIYGSLVLIVVVSTIVSVLAAVTTFLLIVPVSGTRSSDSAASFFEALSALVTVVALLLACYFAVAAVETYRRSRSLDEQLQAAQKASARLEELILVSQRRLNAIHEVNLSIHQWAYHLAGPLVQEIMKATKDTDRDHGRLKKRLRQRLRAYYDQIELSRVRVLLCDCCDQAEAISCLQVLSRCGQPKDLELIVIIGQQFPDDRNLKYLCTRAVNEINRRFTDSLGE